MLLLRLWLPRYPTETPRRGGGVKKPLSVQVAFQRTFKVEEKKKKKPKVKEPAAVEVSRPIGPLILKAPAPRIDLTPVIDKLEGKLFELALLAGLEDQAAKQEAAILLALRNREEEDLLLMLLLEA